MPSPPGRVFHSWQDIAPFSTGWIEQRDRLWAWSPVAAAPCGSRGSFWLGLELFEYRRVVGGCPFFEDSALVVHHEDVEQLPDDFAAVGLKGADR
jgi:hypothetical protein